MGKIISREDYMLIKSLINSGTPYKNITNVTGFSSESIRKIKNTDDWNVWLSNKSVKQHQVINLEKESFFKKLTNTILRKRS